jgi:hypothetical protein
MQQAMGTCQTNPGCFPATNGHTSVRMTAHYSGEILLEDVRAAFSEGCKKVESENKENEVAA